MNAELAGFLTRPERPHSLPSYLAHPPQIQSLPRSFYVLRFGVFTSLSQPS